MPISGSGRLPFQLSLGNGQMRVGEHGNGPLGAGRWIGRRALDLWAEAYAATLSYTGHKGRFNLIYAGADYQLRDRVLVGGLVQFDRSRIAARWPPARPKARVGWPAPMRR